MMMIKIDLDDALEAIVKNLNDGAQRSTSFRQNPDLEPALYPTCAYRGARGAKCFIGMLIDDNDYNPTWDSMGYSVLDLLEKDITVYGSNDECINRDALVDLQNIHDERENWDLKEGRTVFNIPGWKALKEWAEFYRVEWPESKNDE